ncbi:MAG: hypothetical protein LBU51_11475 [Bacteroidales bacterium]|nr:hypothetical protein [Bacteroidales bacterium]
MQKSGEAGITKTEQMSWFGECGQSINNWRKAYRKGGFQLLMGSKKKC